MKLEIKELRDGVHIGKEVWICDYRWTDFDKKEDRNIKPTKVLIRDTDDTTKRVNYSHCFFSEIKKDKVVNSSLIKLFDNTGYRSFAGIALNVFTTEGECRKHYKKQAEIVFKEFENYKSTKLRRLDIISNQIVMLL
jgi:hypothetical protein